MTNLSQTYAATVADIDAANAADPRVVEHDGKMLPFEVAYAERLTQALLRLYPDATELMLIAARAQHVRRWEIARSTYPVGRQGYEGWRVACRLHHAAIAGEIMARHGYGADEIARAGMLIKKEQLKRDPQSQALEDAVALVFLEYYAADFIADHGDYDDEKLAGIFLKTLKKMSARGREAALGLCLPKRVGEIAGLALARSANAGAARPE